MFDQLLLELKNQFEQQPGTSTAFSGGIDSALVLFLSRKFLGKNRAVGVISKSESLKKTDYELAINFAKTHDINLQTIYTKELSDTQYNKNPHNRCYFCKTHLYKNLRKIANVRTKQTSLNSFQAQTWLTHLDEPINFMAEKMPMETHIPISKNGFFFLKNYQEKLDGMLISIWENFEKSNWNVEHRIHASNKTDEYFTKQYLRIK